LELIPYFKSTLINLKPKSLNLRFQSKSVNSTTPVIFNKKLNKSNIKKLNYIYNDTGRVKHFPPAAQEWYNSIYAYNNNYTKGLPALDKSLINILKGYFSMFISHKDLDTKYVSKLYRKRSPKKIFIGKGELKHTSTKAIITFYVYNTEKIALKREYKKLYISFFSPKKKHIMNKNNLLISFINKPLKRQIVMDDKGNILKDSKGNDVIIYNRPYTLEEFLNSPKHIITKINSYYDKTMINEFNSDTSSFAQITFYDAYYSILNLFIDNLSKYLSVLNKYFEFLTKLVQIKILSNSEKSLIFTNLLKNLYTFNYPDYEYYKKKADRKYLKSLYRLQYLLKFNSVKFERPFITRLISLIERLYNKKIEFNIVNLNKIHLNSDILTQAIVLKLKNKKNKFYKIFRSSLNKVKIPNVDRLNEKIDQSNKKNYFINKIRNVYINNMFNRTSKGDSLNELLSNYFSSGNNLEIEDLYNVKRDISLRDYVFRYLKHFRLGGVRLEAKGRLSKRFTASRSVFKLNWKGGLKNVDSSFKGLSTVMLRGNSKSNIEYTMLRSKYRIGAFGIKGWVSSK
jgi:hypothetical protein